MAALQELGILSQRRTGIDFADFNHPAFGRKDLSLKDADFSKK